MLEPTYNANDAGTSHPPGKLGCVQLAPRFAARVLLPDAFIAVIVHVVKVDSRLRRRVSRAGRYPHDAHRPGCRRRRLLGCPLQHGPEEARQEKVAEVVDA